MMFQVNKQRKWTKCWAIFRLSSLLVCKLSICVKDKLLERKTTEIAVGVFLFIFRTLFSELYCVSISASSTTTTTTHAYTQVQMGKKNLFSCAGRHEQRKDKWLEKWRKANTHKHIEYERKNVCARSHIAVDPHTHTSEDKKTEGERERNEKKDWNPRQRNPWKNLKHKTKHNSIHMLKCQSRRWKQKKLNGRIFLQISTNKTMNEIE